MHPVTYQTEPSLTSDEFIDLLVRSTLAERRPVEDRERIETMLRNADLILTARIEGRLVGVARAITDFAYCCYLSDLAIDEAYQRKGMGKALIALTQSRLGPRAKLILLAAPKAMDYYPKIGFQAHPSAWVIEATTSLA